MERLLSDILGVVLKPLFDKNWEGEKNISLTANLPHINNQGSAADYYNHYSSTSTHYDNDE